MRLSLGVLACKPMQRHSYELKYIAIVGASKPVRSSINPMNNPGLRRNSQNETKRAAAI
jgi:hypothetical protein